MTSAYTAAPARLAPLATIGVAVAVASWGFGSVVVKLAEAPGLTFTFYRLWAGALVMVVAQGVTRRPLGWRQIRRSAAGGVLFGADVALYFSALKLTSVADATLIGALQPALVLLVAGRWFGERVGRREVGWTGVAILGVAIVILGSSGTPVWSLRGDLLAVAALLAWTGYFLVSKRVRSDVEPLEYMTAVMLVAAIVVTPVAVLSGQDLGVMDADDWAWLAVFVVGPGAGGHLVVAWAHRYVDVSVSSLIVVGMPVVAALFATLLLDEPLTAVMAVGGAVAIGAIAALVRRHGDLDPDPEPLR